LARDSASVVRLSIFWRCDLASWASGASCRGRIFEPGAKQSQPRAGFSSPLLCILSCSRAAKRRKSQGAACDARHISFMARVPDWSRCESFLGGSHRSRGAPTLDSLPVKVVPAVFSGRVLRVTSVTYNRPSPGLHSPATVNCQFQPFSSR